MTADDFPAWAEHSVDGFAAQQVASGAMPRPEALAYAREQMALLLPDGLGTPGHLLWSVQSQGEVVGHLWVELRFRSDGVEAYVYDVELLEQARGRGLGRATMLLAEGEARQRGAIRMALNVFGHNLPALRLYDSLGYQAVASMMTRRIDGTEPSPAGDGPTVVLQPMTAHEFTAYRGEAERDYARSIADSGMLPQEEARRKAEDEFGRLLPDGLATSGHLFWTARAAHDVAGGSEDHGTVGMVWLHLTERSDGMHAYGYDFSVREPLRRQGYGRAILVAAEQICRAHGVRSVALSVFGPNKSARTLYERLGFEVSAQQMKKPL